MAHGDESGLVLPPRIAPIQVVVVPIFRSDAERSQIEAALAPVLQTLDDDDLRVKVDWRDERPGFKFNEWELKGVPIRLEVGPRDLAKGEVTIVQRLDRTKQAVPLGDLPLALPAMLNTIQVSILARGREFRANHTVRVDSLPALVKFFTESTGFVIAPWCESTEDEARVQKEAQGVTTRVLVPGAGPPASACAICGRPATTEVVWAKAY
jgi:prolyl-tRNA synthetase